MGTPEFAVPGLDLLIRSGYEIPAVVTAPDKPRGRGQRLSPAPVKELALQHGLAVLQPDSLKDPHFAGAMASLAPDLMVVVAFRILPPEVFSIPRLGAFNLHASLLPQYRGAAPINRAIMNGEKETGVTTFFLQERVDTGNVLLQARLPILPEDNAGTMHNKLAEVGAEIVLHTVRLIEQGKAVARPQNDALASPAPKIFREDCRIEWNRPAVSIHNHIRGLSPYPGAFTEYGDRVLKIHRTTLTGASSSGPPGTMYVNGGSILASTADHDLVIEELQLQGGKRMPAAEFLRGHTVTAGDRLGGAGAAGRIADSGKGGLQ